MIRRPYDLYRAGVFDEYLMGLMNQVAQAMDDSITQEVTNHLFKKEGARLVLHSDGLLKMSITKIVFMLQFRYGFGVI